MWQITSHFKQSILRGESSKNPSRHEQIGELFLFELNGQDKQKEELNSQAKHWGSHYKQIY